MPHPTINLISSKIKHHITPRNNYNKYNSSNNHRSISKVIIGKYNDISPRFAHRRPRSLGLSKYARYRLSGDIDLEVERAAYFYRHINFDDDGDDDDDVSSSVSDVSGISGVPSISIQTPDILSAPSVLASTGSCYHASYSTDHSSSSDLINFKDDSSTSSEASTSSDFNTSSVVRTSNVVSPSNEVNTASASSWETLCDGESYIPKRRPLTARKSSSRKYLGTAAGPTQPMAIGGNVRIVPDNFVGLRSTWSVNPCKYALFVPGEEAARKYAFEDEWREIFALMNAVVVW